MICPICRTDFDNWSICSDCRIGGVVVMTGKIFRIFDKTQWKFFFLDDEGEDVHDEEEIRRIWKLGAFR